MELERNKDCPFCEFGMHASGYINERGSGIVYRTGDNPAEDWFVALQPTTASDPKTGMNYQVMPVGHLVSLGDMGAKIQRANLGDVLCLTSAVMNRILEKDHHKILGEQYTLKQLVNAKCEKDGKFPHMHFKLLPRTGAASIDTPLDVGYAKKEVFSDEEGQYVKSRPGKKQKLDSARWRDLFNRSLDLYWSFSRFLPQK